MGLLLLDIRDKVAVLASDQASTDLEPAGKPNPLNLSGSKKVYLVQSFKGVVGYFGSESVGSRRTHEWLTDFIARHPTLTTIDLFATKLAESVSQDMVQPRLRLGFFVVGYASQGPQFWYVWNYSQLEADGSYGSVEDVFKVRNELGAYIADATSGDTRNEASVRGATTFQFRNGTLFPFNNVVQGLEAIINGLPLLDSRFAVLRSVDQLAAYTLFKMEFVKRLYSKLDYQDKRPIDGPVTTYALDENGIWQKHKNSFKKIL